MGYGTRQSYFGNGNNSIRTYWPDDTDNQFYLTEGYSLADIIQKAKDKWGPDIDLDDLILNPEHIHTDCLGYDRYEPSDYTNFICVNKK